MIEEQKKIYLCRPNGSILYQLNGVQTDSVNYGVQAKNYNELSFQVDRYLVVDGEQVESSGYEQLKHGMYVLLPELDMFQVQEPTLNNDGVKEYKTVKAYSLEHEFQEKNWNGSAVNRGTPDSMEYTTSGNLDNMGFAKEPIYFYRSNSSGKTNLSLLHLVLEQIPGWSVDDIDVDFANENLWNKIISFEATNTNLYALLTSTIAPKAECIFLFDTINKKLKVVSKESLDAKRYDTSVFVSLRNLAQNISVSVNEDSIYTVFKVQGGDDKLKVSQVNFNDMYIYDLSYFMSEPWMSSTLVNKIKAWQRWRDDNRQTFIQLSKDQTKKVNDIYEVENLCPNDGDDWQQWDTMALDGLNSSLEMYERYLNAIRANADPDPQYDENGDYIVRKTASGEVDDTQYLAWLEDSNKGYYTYLEINKYIIPNIKIAISNKGKTSDQKTDYVKEFETNWELYGIQLLTAKRDSYLNQFAALTCCSKDWGQLTSADWDKLVAECPSWITITTAQWNALSAAEKAVHPLKDKYNIEHQKYMEIKGYLGDYNSSTDTYTTGSLRDRLQKLEKQKATLESELATIDNQVKTYTETAKITNSEWGLTSDELKLFYNLCRYSDYTNSNFIVTSIDEPEDIIDTEVELYEDAVNKLSEVSQPQYRFSVGLDNFFNLDEFYSWKDQFELLKFMRLGVRDDYSVKLRLIGYTSNPCEIDPLLSVEFSNFVTSKSGRSDLTELLSLSSGGNASQNSISVGTGASKDATEYATTLFYMMSRSGLMNSYNKRNSSDITTTNSPFSGVSTANLIKLYSTTGYVTDMTMSEVKVTDYIDVVKLNAATVTAGTVIADRLLLKGNASGILYQLNNRGTLQSESIDTLDGYILTERTINADKIIAHSITVNEITAENITGTNGWINLVKGTFEYRNPEHPNDYFLAWDGTELSIGGSVTAYDGNIGGWDVQRTYLGKGTIGQSGSVFLYPGGATATIAGTSRSGLVITAGANFGITNTGAVYANDVTLTGGTLKSANYSYLSGTYSAAGTLIDLSTGLIRSKNFCIDASGNANISGKITATSGSLSNLTVTGYLTTNANRTAYNQAVAGMTITPSGIGGWGSATSYWNMTTGGVLTAYGASITGTITANTLTATTSGQIGCWTIDSNTRLYASQSNGVQTAYTSLQPAFINVARISGTPYIQAYLLGGDGAVSTRMTHTGIFHAEVDGTEHTLWGVSYNSVLNMYVKVSYYRTVYSGAMYLYSDGGNHGLSYTTEGNFRLLTNGDGALGTSSQRWKTLYCQSSPDVSSDRKLKDNISDITFAKELILSLNPVTFMWKDGDHRRKQMGLIAQEASKVCKDIGENLSFVRATYNNNGKYSYDKNGEYYGEEVDDDDLTWGISYDQLIAPTIKVVQELYTEIQSLKQQLKDLKEKQ